MILKQLALLKNWSTTCFNRRGFCAAASAETMLNNLINHEQLGVPSNAGTDSAQGFDLVG